MFSMTSPLRISSLLQLSEKEISLLEERIRRSGKKPQTSTPATLPPLPPPSEDRKRVDRRSRSSRLQGPGEVLDEI